MHWLKTSFFVLLLVLSARSQSQDSPLGELRLEMGPEAVKTLLARQGLEPVVLHPDKAAFPLAAETEAHWVVSGYRAAGHTLEKLALVFADGRLVFQEGTGGAIALLDAFKEAAYQQYEAYRFYQDWSLVANAASDRFWQLNPDGMHLNLFAWHHPLLEGDTLPDYPMQVAVPEYLQMGASLGQLEPQLGAVASFIIREELDGSDPNAQLQLNCYGIPFAGFSRKVEARFGDDRLNVAWILTARAEEARIRAALQATYGNPVFVSDDWEAYRDWQVFLRKDKPEVLLLTPELGQYYKKEYFGQ